MRASERNNGKEKSSRISNVTMEQSVHLLRYNGRNKSVRICIRNNATDKSARVCNSITDHIKVHELVT